MRTAKPTDPRLLDKAFQEQVVERLWEKSVKSETGCWLYMGRKGKTGYGRIWLFGTEMPVHRVSLMMQGVELRGLGALHRCNVRNCWNPDHLYPGTQHDNVMDAVRSGTWCGRPSHRRLPPDVKLARQRAQDSGWRKKNRLHVREYARAYYQANADRMRARARELYAQKKRDQAAA